MALPTAVNGQITDAITQANLTTLGQTPSVSVGVLSQSLSHSLSILYANAVSAQQNMSVVAQAATARAVTALTGADPK
ncbi:RebB family R body protein [Kordiimonas aestuarii]|uniref:RebB family R body protein n=1 Tax=Kordiimonas aestuarii TaxID=1005925 RepID=UPI0021D0B361|nr:RebB family R body protein [Kordiimonas aestuarii]